MSFTDVHSFSFLHERQHTSRRTTKQKKGRGNKRNQFLLLQANKFQNTNLKNGGSYLYFSNENARAGECKYVEVRYVHLTATIQPNTQLEWEV